jgi:hypothetical protein
MNHSRVRAVVVAGMTVAILGAGANAAQEGAQSPEQRIAALKKSMAESQARLRKYEWIETTSLSLKGEEKSRKQMRVYYGADGKLQKIPIGDQPQAEQSGGRRGGRLKQRIVENKKDEMKEYMERAAALVHRYVPPNPDDIDAAKKTGKMVVRPVQGGRARVEFSGYLQPGDMLAIDVDGEANRLTGLNVNSYLDTPEDAVILKVQLGALADGTSYTAQTTLDAQAKHITVVVQNAGHRPIGQ